MFRASVIAVAIAASLAQAQAESAKLKSAGCAEYVQAFNEYTQKVEGKLVKKHSIFEMTEWARNSRFQGFVLTEKAPANAEVVLESKASSKAKTVTTKTAKTKPFEQDKKYRIVDIDVQKQLGSAPRATGTYVVKVIADGQILCTDKKAIYNDGD